MLDVRVTPAVKDEPADEDGSMLFSNDRGAPIDLTQDEDEFPDDDDVRAMSSSSSDAGSDSDSDSESDSDSDSESDSDSGDRRRRVIVIPDPTPEDHEAKAVDKLPIADTDRAPPTPPANSDTENEATANTEQVRLRQQM
jgi:hypothetical protein